MASFTCCPAGKVVQNKCDGTCIIQGDDKCSVETIDAQDCKSQSNGHADYTCCPGTGKVIRRIVLEPALIRAREYLQKGIKRQKLCMKIAAQKIVEVLSIFAVLEK